MSETKREDEAYIRVGDTAVLLSWEGDGRQRKLVGHIVREIPPAVLKTDPAAAEKWTLEELIALRSLIKKAETHAIAMQSTNLRLASHRAEAQREAQANKGAAEEENEK